MTPSSKRWKWEEVGIQEVSNSHAAELTVKNFKWLTLLSGSQDEEYSDTSGKALATCALKKSLQVPDDLVNHLFEVNHFMHR
jgi:hypothetical protein